MSVGCPTSTPGLRMCGQLVFFVPRLGGHLHTACSFPLGSEGSGQPQSASLPSLPMLLPYPVSIALPSETIPCQSQRLKSVVVHRQGLIVSGAVGFIKYDF